jgi:uncharacterized protein YggE
MNKILVLSTVVMGVLAVSACHINGDKVVNPKKEESSQRTIIVQGTGEVNVVPNTASVQVAVETNAAQANEAVTTNAAQMTQVVNQLKAKLGKDDKLSTSRYNLNPVYKYDQTQQQSVLTGYQVTNYVTFTTKQLDELGAILDALAQVGANRIDSLQFSHDQMSTYTQQALSAAVKDARATAETLASAAEVTLGPVMQIQPQVNTIGPLRETMMLKASVNAASQTPVVPGELTVSQAVSVTYNIK